MNRFVLRVPGAGTVTRGLSQATARLAATSLAGAMFVCGTTWAVNPNAPPSLKIAPVPEPPNLAEFVKDRGAAIQLGKALFWDMQVGSDGVQACASCHFHAGADSRAKNQVSPGLNAGDTAFEVRRPNGVLRPTHFPFHKLLDPDNRNSPVLFDSNDVTSSQGVRLTDFLGIATRGRVDQGTSVPDPVFNVGGINTRRVEPRNSPSVINAVFNFANFWDGRANNIFNGVNPFGPMDPDARIYVNNTGTLTSQAVRIPNASLASQAVGPSLSNFEMSFAGRSFPHLGKKMLRLRPLARQIVHPEDSVLGSLSAARFDAQGTLVERGLRTTYPALIRAAFHDKYWNSTQPITLGSEHFSQMEANFSLFFGLAILMYESTLVSDDTPFDRFQEGDNTALTAQQQIGLNTFIREGQCMACHRGSEFTNATVNDPLPRPLEGIVERMDMALGEAFYDNGFYNIGVRPTGEDLGRGGTAPFINPATDEPFPLSFTRLALLEDNGFPLPFSIRRLPCGNAQPSPCPLQRAAVDGAFKTPGLRNVELTGPYFHNGGQATLRQVVKFYARGGDFHDQNLDNLDPNIDVLVGLHGQPAKEVALVDFLLALTDDRVRFERAPFDHPEIFPNGSPGNHTALRCAAGSTCDSLFKIPPVGASGRSTPIRTFLGIDPFQP